MSAKSCSVSGQIAQPPLECEASAALRVQLLYEDRATGIRAKRLLLGIEEALKPEFECTLEICRFDLLDEPDCSSSLARGVGGTELMLLSAHGNRLLPEAVKVYLWRWLGIAADLPSALVISLDPAARRSATARLMLGWLERTVEEAGGYLFCHFGELPFEARVGAPTRGTLPAGSSRDFRLLPPAHRARHWGINE